MIHLHLHILHKRNAINYIKNCTRRCSFTLRSGWDPAPPNQHPHLQSSNAGATAAALGCAIPIDSYKSCPLAAWNYEDFISVEAGEDVTCALLEDGLAECCESCEASVHALGGPVPFSTGGKCTRAEPCRFYRTMPQRMPSIFCPLPILQGAMMLMSSLVTGKTR